MIQSFKQNTKGTDYVVGDIHGMFSLLKAKLDELGFNPEVDRLFSVGDLVDRGIESEKCLEWLSKPWFRAVRGNHEQMIIDAYREDDDRYVAHSFQNGGAWFFYLFDEDKLSYVEAFEELPYVIEVETINGLVGIVHAGSSRNWELFKSNVALQDEHTINEAMWTRTKIKSKDTSDIVGLHKLYVGHTPMLKVTELGNVVYVDTGAVYTQDGGFLTVLRIN